MKSRAGLKTVQLPSPFNYRDQALVIIPRNFPVLKGAAGDPLFNEMLVESLAEAAIETKGRMLVLFTSYRMLKQVYDPLKEALGRKRHSSAWPRHRQRQPQQADPAVSAAGGVRVCSVRAASGKASIFRAMRSLCLAIVRLPFPAAESSARRSEIGNAAGAETKSVHEAVDSASRHSLQARLRPACANGEGPRNRHYL